MTAAALGLVAVWAALLVASARAADPGRARRTNLAMLAAAVLASGATCAAPVVRLVGAFHEVAGAAPADKVALLEARLDALRTVELLALLSIPILVAGGVAFASNRRRLRGAPPGPAR